MKEQIKKEDKQMVDAEEKKEVSAVEENRDESPAVIDENRDESSPLAVIDPEASAAELDPALSQSEVDALLAGSSAVVDEAQPGEEPHVSEENKDRDFKVVKEVKKAPKRLLILSILNLIFGGLVSVPLLIACAVVGKRLKKAALQGASETADEDYPAADERDPRAELVGLSARMGWVALVAWPVAGALIGLVFMLVGRWMV